MTEAASKPAEVPHVVATVRNYDQLRVAISTWCQQQGITRAELDADAGLADGHSGKLLAPRAVKKFGNATLHRVLAATGLVLLLATDAEAAAQITSIDSGQSNASDGASERATHWRSKKGNAWGRRMAARRALILSREERTASARKAAQARWASRKEPPPPTSRHPADDSANAPPTPKT